VKLPKTILIVEDNALNMKMFNDLLQAHGYKTLQSIDGGDVLELVKEHRPDLIVMDIQLPETSGLELTQMLKADDGMKHIPVLAVTAFAMRGNKKTIFEAGCDDYIAKPISISILLGKIVNLLP
jgi:two-component system cell cycle response regulator DivK